MVLVVDQTVGCPHCSEAVKPTIITPQISMRNTLSGLIAAITVRCPFCGGVFDVDTEKMQ